MKLRYRETKWVDAETGIEIAPQDQEKVHLELRQMYGDNKIGIFTIDPTKLYDSGDLVFELKMICPRTNWFIQTKCKRVPSGQECNCDLKEFLYLKSKESN